MKNNLALLFSFTQSTSTACDLITSRPVDRLTLIARVCCGQIAVILTGNVEAHVVDDGQKSLHGRDTFEPRVVLGRAHSERLRPPFGPVSQQLHSTPAEHRRALADGEVFGDVTPVHQQLDSRWWIAADRNAPDMAEMVFDESQDAVFVVR